MGPTGRDLLKRLDGVGLGCSWAAGWWKARAGRRRAERKSKGARTGSCGWLEARLLPPASLNRLNGGARG